MDGAGAGNDTLHKRARECDSPEGEVPQVFIHYGSRCSLELAEEYGFCLGTDHGAAPLGVQVPLEWVFACLNSEGGSDASGSKRSSCRVASSTVVAGQGSRPTGECVSLPTRSEAVLLFRALARLHGCDEWSSECDECG